MARHKRHRVAFRWPWQSKPAPGRVALSADELIELLRASVRCGDLELEAVRLEAEGARLRADAAAQARVKAARALVGEQSAAAGVEFSPLAVDGILADLPTTISGALHQPAFLALLGQHLLEHRLGQSLSTHGDPR